MTDKKNFISISQPTFLPWSGLFDLIDSADKFVFLNDVQFSRQSWQQRNKIISNGKASWVTLPVSKTNGFQMINETKILSDNRDIKKILHKIKQDYSKTKYFETYYYTFEKKFKNAINLDFLDEFNIEIIKWFIEQIGIKTELLKSSDFNIKNQRSMKIIKICKKLKKNYYLCNYGANEYLRSDFEEYKKENIQIFLHNYETKKYTQNSKVFDGYVSILDMLFNEGPKTLSTIRFGRKKPTAFSN